MEEVVIYNLGRQGFKDGLPKVAPETVMYPIVSRYVPYHHEECNLSKWQKRTWEAGWLSASCGVIA